MKWVKKEDNYRVPLKSWCTVIENEAMSQAEDLARHPSVYKHVALMPDCHPGYGMPIGGVIACTEDIIPNAVGVDIGCGMGAVRTSIASSDTARPLLRDVITQVRELIPCGEGKSHRGNQSWENMDEHIDNFKDRKWFSSHVMDLAGKNLGTLGGGNHFIEVQAGDDDRVWLMIHSGSRHLGNIIAKYYHKLALSLNTRWNAAIPAKDLAFLPVSSAEGKEYIHDMNFALAYARENRRQIMDRFMAAFAHVFPGADFEKPINIHHNYAALENHFGRNVWVHRKGATSARKNETGIIPGSMGTPSYIVEGLGNPESFMSCSHGAGRVMGRKQASRTLSPLECDKAMGDVVYNRWNKIRRGKGQGEFDLGEAPQAYKNIEDVIKSELDLIRPVVKLRPLAVVKG
ncbi:MAG: RtcB family protein [Proteobacteria bacterium]|nr:RtcB family protein [Pseudomonadota bacterium]